MGIRDLVRPRSAKIINVRSPDIAKLFPLWGKGAPIYLWADNGLICWEDGRTNGYSTISVQTALERVKGISDMIPPSSEDRRWNYERQAMQTFVQHMELVIRKAQEQGTPDDPQSAATHAARRRAVVSVGRKFDNVVVGDPHDPYDL